MAESGRGGDGLAKRPSLATPRNIVIGAAALVLLAIAVVVAVVRAAGPTFAERDPAGFQACSMHAETSANTDPAVRLGGLLTVGEQARKAATPAIRQAARPLFDADALEATGQSNDFPMIDVDAFRRACEDQGFELTPISK